MRLGIDLEVTVIPGISSIQLLAARHKIILNRVGQPIHVTTGPPAPRRNTPLHWEMWSSCSMAISPAAA